ncbi:hypothetical protein ACP70R_012110 [Stipagrostis hirtigluma subsp. patula]
MSHLQVEPLNLKEATVTCIPRLRGGGLGRRPRRRGGSSATAAPVSVLDRLRDIMLRLAMLSAASSATTTPKQQGALRRTGTVVAATRVSPTAYADTYRSEAVDDCIEFLKRSAAGGGGALPAAVEASTAAASPPLPAPACAM